MINFCTELCDDSAILLNRALKNKTVWAFGTDGHGQHGESYFAKQFTISGLNFYLLEDEQCNDDALIGRAVIYLDGFNENDCGHVSTDNNFKISINKLLQEHSIDEMCWEFAHYSLQNTVSITLDIDIQKLLN